MSKKTSVIYFVIFGVVLGAAAAVSGVTAGPGGLPQNTNSSTMNAPEDIASPQVDLSGTYSGNIKMTGSHEMSGEGTINMKGEAPSMSSVTIEVGGMTHNGRFSAVTTRGYTGLTMYFPDVEDTATKTGLVVMARAKKKGDRLTLTPVPNARNTISFK